MIRSGFLWFLFTGLVWAGEPTEAWVTALGTEQEHDEGAKIALDGSGNTWVVYASRDLLAVRVPVVKLDSQGQVILEMDHAQKSGSSDVPVVAVVVFPNGDAGVKALWQDRVVIGRYGPAGQVRFLLELPRTFSPPSSSTDHTAQMTVGMDGRLILAFQDGEAVTTMVLNMLGDAIWSRSLAVPGFSRTPTDLHIDGNGNLFVVMGTDPGYTLVSYASNGDERWTFNEAGLFPSPFGPGFAASHPDGSIILATTFENICGIPEAKVRKLSEAGQSLWVREMSVDPCFHSTAADLAVGDFGVTLLSHGELDLPEWRMHLHRLDPDGQILWHGSHSGTGSTTVAAHLALSPNGDGAALGWTSVGSQDKDLVTVRFNNDGQVRWDEEFTSPIPANDRPGAIVNGSMGVTIAGGGAGLSFASHDIYVIRYAASCRGDLNGDGEVDPLDLLLALPQWNTSGPAASLAVSPVHTDLGDLVLLVNGSCLD